MDKITIAVSGINAADNPGPGIGVARSLKKDPDLKTEIVGLAYDAMEPGLYMDWVVDRSYIMPDPVGESKAYLNRLRYICDTQGLDMVIPNLDAELPFYINNSERLGDYGVRTFLPDIKQFRLRAKDRLRGIAKTIGLRVPKTRLVHSPDGLAGALEAIGLPVMVKGIFYEALRAETYQEAYAHFNRLAAVWGYPVIIQQIVAGEHLNVVGVGNGQGKSLGMLGIKKTSLTALGKIWTGITVHNEPMLAAAERLVKKFGWRGPFELECILCGNDIYLIEINPRFPAWVYFATEVGVNLPARLLRHCLNVKNSRLPMVDAGKLFVRYSYELVTDLSQFQTLILQGENP